jgi:DNA-binding transcriptional LysR family regulator
LIDVPSLLVLRAVAANGSNAAAARELGYTRSAVSQRMSALERTAGVALVVRDGRALRLTLAGSRLLEHTERILTELRAAEAGLREASGEIAGTLRVGLPLREGPPLMSSALTSIRKRYPGLLITLASTTDRRGVDELRHGRIDMAMLSRFGVTAGKAGTGIREWVLGRDELKLCVPRGHELAERTSCSMADLAGQNWVLSPTNPLGEVTVGLCQAAGFQPSVVATVDDVATALGLVAVGWGITVAPQLTPAPGDLVRIPLDGVDAYRHSVLMVRAGDEQSPEIATVITAVHQASGRVGYLAPHETRPT